MTDKRLESCPACGAAESEPGPASRAATDPGSAKTERYVLRRCLTCRAEFALPRRAMSYETSDRYKTYQSFLSAEELQGRIHHTRRATSHFKDAPLVYRILEQLSESGVLLDFGAGSGYLSALAAELGFEVHAVEISGKLRGFLESNISSLTTYSSSTEFVDTGKRATAVLAMHVVEHLENPLDQVASLRSALDPAGVLIVVVPNRDRSYYRFGETGAELEEQLETDGLTDSPPNHLTRFTAEAMERLLRRAGFSQVATGFAPVGAWDLFHHGIGDPTFEFRSYFQDPYRMHSIAQLEVALNEVMRRLGHENLGNSLVALASDARATEELHSLLETSRSRLFEVYVRSVTQDLEYHRNELDRLRAELGEAAEGIAARDAYIHSLVEAVSRHEVEAREGIEGIDRILNAKDEYIESLERALARKEAELAGLDRGADPSESPDTRIEQPGKLPSESPA